LPVFSVCEDGLSSHTRHLETNKLLESNCAVQATAAKSPPGLGGGDAGHNAGNGQLTTFYVNRWDGSNFGWFDGDDLYARDGRHVGYRQLDEVYDLKGRYLGDIRQRRLVTESAKLGKTFLRRIRIIRLLGPTGRPIHEAALPMPSGFQDFPGPETL